MYRLVCMGKVQVDRLDELSLDDVELANRALDAWQDAERKASEGN